MRTAVSVAVDDGKCSSMVNGNSNVVVRVNVVAQVTSGGYWEEVHGQDS